MCRGSSEGAVKGGASPSCNVSLYCCCNWYILMLVNCVVVLYCYYCCVFRVDVVPVSVPSVVGSRTTERLPGHGMNMIGKTGSAESPSVFI